MSSPNKKLFHYFFKNNGATKTLFLLHGTGGSEQDLMFLNEHLKQSYNLVGLRGNVEENGMRRFFKRLDVGVFDKESIKEEAAKLKKFMIEWQEEQFVSAENCVALGFSNGANMILATALLYPDTQLFKRAVLLHPMMPFSVKAGSVSLKGLEVLVTHGDEDSMMTTAQQDEVDATLQATGAEVTVKHYDSDHRVTREEVQELLVWLKK